VKNIIPALKGIPVTLKNLSSKKPVRGRISNLNNEAKKEAVVLFAIPLKESDPPIDINARGQCNRSHKAKGVVYKNRESKV